MALDVLDVVVADREASRPPCTLRSVLGLKRRDAATPTNSVSDSDVDDVAAVAPAIARDQAAERREEAAAFERLAGPGAAVELADHHAERERRDGEEQRRAPAVEDADEPAGEHDSATPRRSRVR